MRTACGIWELWCPPSGGTGELDKDPAQNLLTNRKSFLLKDAEEDLAGQRLKQ